MQLDDDFFAGLGQKLTEVQKDKIAGNIYSQLEDRVGELLEARVSDQQFEQFEMLIAKGSDQELDTWLSQNAPGYDQLVEQTFEQIKQEAKLSPAKFLE